MVNLTSENSSGAPVFVTFLGGLQLTIGSGVLADDINRSQKIWGVLSYLLVHRDRPVPQAEFIKIFWPDDHSSNPANALKTLLYRIRVMLEPLFKSDMQPILSQWGAYSWNPELHCILDIDRFEELCRKADEERDRETRIALYREALGLYRGDFLPKLSGQMWIIPIQTHYHSLYLTAVKELALMLEDSGEFEEMGGLCHSAIQLDELDEQLHLLYIRALARQGKTAAALAHYSEATDLLYRNLDVRPSQELRALYSELMHSEQALETDLSVIQEDLRESVTRQGAFVCHYGFFREIYRLEARRCLRDGTSVHIALITLSMPGGGVPPLNILGDAMDRLQDVLVQNLRRGDVVSKYSGAQFVVMLISANLEDSGMVMSRIASAFSRQQRYTLFKLSYKIRELELT